MRIHVDRDKCVGGGQCVVAAPEVFDQDDDGLVVVLDEHPDADLDDVVEDAELLCPARVITVERT